MSDQETQADCSPVVNVYSNRGVIEVENPKARSENERKKIFTYDAVYDWKFVAGVFFVFVFNGGVAVRHSSAFMMKWSGLWFHRSLMAIMGVFSRMDKLELGKLTQWRGLRRTRSILALFQGLLIKSGTILTGLLV